MSESNRNAQFCDLFGDRECTVAIHRHASSWTGGSVLQLLQVDSELLAFFVQMASFKSEGTRGLRDVAVVLVEFAEYLRAFEG